MPAKPLAREALDAFGLEAVCNAIADRSSLTAIAEQVDVSVGSLLTWIDADPERSARVREVRASTARLWDERAESLLENATDDMGLKKAKELAHHYRWRAAKIAPRDYGDKMTLANDPESPFGQLTDEQVVERFAKLQGKSQ